jgi:hypothetical protein
MDLTPYVTALRDDLAAAASVGDEQTARAGTALAGALEPAVRLALQNALSDLTTEISEKLGDRSVSLRLRGREVEVAVDREEGGPEAAEEPASGFFAGPSASPFAGPGGPFRRPGFDAPGAAGRGADMGDISRMTLRLVDQIKGQAEQAAAAQGMSLNSWISQAVQGALRDNLGQHGRRRWEGSWDPQRRSGESPEPPPAPDAGSGPGEKPDDGPDDGGSGVSGWVRG